MEITENQIKEIAFIDSKLKGCNDLETIILKGHLLTEYYVDKLIESATLKGQEYKAAAFTYQHKIEIVRFVGLSAPSELFPILTSLNSLRNKIAHNLTFDENQVKSFIGDVEKLYEPLGKMPLEDSLKHCFSFVCGGLHAIEQYLGALTTYLKKHIEEQTSH